VGAPGGAVVTWRRLTPADLAYAAVVVSLTFLAARVWWLSAIVPGQDYPQFLVFVRAARDYADPSSPFHGTYTIAPWYLPTVLPTQLTRVLAMPFGGSIESGVRLLLTLQNVGLVMAGMVLLRVLGRSRWAIVLLFPFVHSRWTVIGGFVAYATAFPLVVLGWALTVRWLHRRSPIWGVLLGACLCVTLLWHGLGFAVLALGFGGLWLLWRAPSRRARALSLLPMVPSVALMAAWLGSTFEHKSGGGALYRWRSEWETFERILDHVFATVPHTTARALVLVIVLVGGRLLSRRNLGASGSTSRMWRVRNPFLCLAGMYMVAYLVFPFDLLGVEIFAPRFSVQAAMAAVFGWNLPAAPRLRAAIVAAVGLFAAWNLEDIALRFGAFDAETRGASYLMDEVGLHETMYCWPTDLGNSRAFTWPNKAMIEIQQFATARHGGLPNSSFAGYGVNYVRYVAGDPMPFLHGPPVWSLPMTRFDYVLAQVGHGPPDVGFRRIDEREGWELYAVCGSKRLPTCWPGMGR
jgi:hypothetical protein